ncbi:MAG: hypothetical protein WCK17_16285 [Verrucomicrobiota bacterium]
MNSSVSTGGGWRDGCVDEGGGAAWVTRGPVRFGALGESWGLSEGESKRSALLSLFKWLSTERAGGQHMQRLHLDLLATMTAGSSPALYHPDNLGGEIGDGQEKRDAQPGKPLRRKLRCRFHEEQR